MSLFARDAGLSMDALISMLAQQQDPVAWLTRFLEAQRMPSQPMRFYANVISGIVLHSFIIICIIVATDFRRRNGHFWLTRQHQDTTRLNSTVMVQLFLAAYSTTAIIYSALLLHQQSTGQYLRGSAAFQLSCFVIISAMFSVNLFSYYRSLPVGFENKVMRFFFRKKGAAVDARVFGTTLFCVWLILVTAGIMVAPIINDYWLNRADATMATMLEYLNLPSVTSAGFPALTSLLPQAQLLLVENERATHALRVQLLVWVSLSVVYAVVSFTVGWKLFSLLNQQISSLIRAAEDYFRAGSQHIGHTAPNDHASTGRDRRANTSKVQKDGYQQSPNFDKYLAQTATVVCHNCNGSVPVTVRFAKDSAERLEPVPTGLAHRANRLAGHISIPEFPLTRAKKLARIRTELSVFTNLAWMGLVAFIIGCSVIYRMIPDWDTVTIVFVVYTLSLWCYAVPTGVAVGFYVYLSFSMPRAVPSTPGTPRSAMSKRSASTMFKEKIPLQALSTFGGPMTDHTAYTATPPPARTKRSEPTFPRAPSVVSYTTTEAAAEADRQSEASSFVPPLPTIVRKASQHTRQWIRHERQSRELLSQPAQLSGCRNARNVPMSQSQSWLELDDEQ